MSTPPTGSVRAVPASTIIDTIKDQFSLLDQKSQGTLLQSLRQLYIKNYLNQLNDDEFLLACMQKQMELESHTLTSYTPSMIDSMLERYKSIRDVIIKYPRFINIDVVGDHRGIYMNAWIKNESKTQDILLNVTKLISNGKLSITVTKTIRYPPNEDGGHGISSWDEDISIIDIISDENTYNELMHDWGTTLNMLF